MQLEKKSNQKSKFPKIESGKPCILRNRIGEYPIFCIQDIYYDLFVDIKTENWLPPKPPLICLSKSSNIRSKKDLLSFILPSDIFAQIEGVEENGKSIVLDNDYREFFFISTNNNKITKLLFNIFSNEEKDSEKNFIDKVQRHFVKILHTAEYFQPNLTEYLYHIGDKLIVPSNISKQANDVFHNLIDTKDHDSIARAIANIFISAMLGLYSMKYSSESKRGYSYSRTYLLNRLGMEFIWLPESISSSYIKLEDTQAAYNNGEYTIAYRQVHKWIDENASHAKSEELSKAYKIIGLCLYHHPKECISNDSTTINIKLDERISRGINFLEKCIATGIAEPEVHYLLFEYYEDSNRTLAYELLHAAFEQNYAKAVIKVVALYISGHQIFDSITAEQLYEKLNQIIDNEVNFAEIEVSECLYMRGMLKRHDGAKQEAEYDFLKAAKVGHEKARQEISRKERMERQSFPSLSTNPQAPCCLTNSLSGNNLSVISSLPTETWSLFTLRKNDHLSTNATKLCNIDEFIQMEHLDEGNSQRSRIVILFMSEDKDANLNECLVLLDKLFNIALNASEKQKRHLIDSIDIYVNARYEIASMLIDANIGDMGSDIYFKVHVLDETRDAVHHLLCEAPLFLPYLNTIKKENSANIMLFGSTETNYRFIKESIACAYLGETFPINITLLGTDAICLKKRLKQECPGIYHGPFIECIRPSFIECNIDEIDFPSYIYGCEHDNNPDDPIVNALNDGNYFVVDLSNDYKSIQFAMNLRTWILRSKGTFDRVPFIAVKCVNIQNSYLAAHLTLAGQVAGNAYYSKYDLFPFGMTSEMYSYQRLIEKPKLEEVALRVHKSYYGADEMNAENDYYSFSYNADSSLMTAIGLSYRLFAGAAFFKRKDKYLNFGIFEAPELYSDYFNTIENKASFEIAAALEQSRWNGFMLSRGWESASINQVLAYKNQSTGFAHKHTLAKLHPFIREWEDLNDDELIKILGILKSKFNYNKHPQKTTRESIKNTVRFLSRDTINRNDKEH